MKDLALEQSYYYERCKEAYHDNMVTILSMDVYSNAQKYSAMAEVAYVLDNGELPKWATIIERIEKYNDNHLFIYHNLSGH